MNVILVKIENVLKSWKRLVNEGKSKIWKTLAISKIVHLVLITNVPTFIIKQFNIIKKLNLARKKKTLKDNLLYEIPTN